MLRLLQRASSECKNTVAEASQQLVERGRRLTGRQVRTAGEREHASGGGQLLAQAHVVHGLTRPRAGKVQAWMQLQHRLTAAARQGSSFKFVLADSLLLIEAARGGATTVAA
jgi:hypothetical protein